MATIPEPLSATGDTVSERIKASVTVLELVNQYVDLKPTASGAVGLCPFHEDHHPSFGVNIEGNFWNCFAGCGGGSVIDFWMRWRKCDFTTAARELAERGGSRLRQSASRFTVDLLLNSGRYGEYRQRERELDFRRYDIYVTAPIPEVEVLAGKLLRLGRERGYRSYDQTSNTLAFTQQCIRYTCDRSPETGEVIEYPKYPIESLMEEAGDREDQAILTAALLKRMGYDAALLVCPGHVAVGVAGAEGLPGTCVTDPVTGVRCFYAETTAGGWLLGELPKDLEPYLARGEFEIVPVVMRSPTEVP